MANEQTFEGIYVRRDGNKAIVSFNLYGTPINVAFPYGAVAKTGVKKGEKFKWNPKESYDVEASDIELIKDGVFTEEQEEKIAKFLEKAIPRHKRLEQLSSE